MAPAASKFNQHDEEDDQFKEIFGSQNDMKEEIRSLESKVTKMLEFQTRQERGLVSEVEDI